MIRDHLNHIYNGNLDMDAIIGAVQPELDRQFNTIRNHFNDAFPIIATPDGIFKWERILEIVADPTVESIEFRQERIISRLSNNIPFTERTLQELLGRTIIAEESPFAGTWQSIEENFAYWEDAERQYSLWSDLEQASATITSAWSYVLDYRNYKLDIYMYRPSRNWIKELNSILQQMIPANITWKIHLSYPLWSSLEGDYNLWQDVEGKHNIWQDIEEDYEDD